MMCCVGRKNKNILAIASTKTKYALVLFEDDPLINQISGIWSIRNQPDPRQLSLFKVWIRLNRANLQESFRIRSDTSRSAS